MRSVKIPVCVAGCASSTAQRPGVSIVRILDPPPAEVKTVLASLTAALDRPPGGGGVPAKDPANVLIATWNIRELGGFTDKWVSGPGDSPTRDVRSL